MLHIEKLQDGLEVFKALGSDVRIRIVELLTEHSMNMNELATELHITNGALTTHIKKLEECGIVTTSNESPGHGNQKLCSVVLDKILIDVKRDWSDDEDSFTTDIGVGRYSSFKVYPTCGLATAKSVIGEVDDYRYFSHPNHFDADILWFTRGFVEYQIPNFTPGGQRITKLTVSAELSSEAPGVNNTWPSDISFYINDTCVGTWTSPGDYGDVRGIFTPSWWFPNWNQYGLLKMLVINAEGTYMDGLKISDVCIGDLVLEERPCIRLRFAVEDDAKNVGGLTIFGRNFGNFSQDIRVTLGYVPSEKNALNTAQ